MQPSSEHESSPLAPQEQRKERHARDQRLDAERIASMADEGGRTGARMDLRDQLADDREHVLLRPERAARAWMWGLAGLAGGVLAALVIPRLCVTWR